VRFNRIQIILASIALLATAVMAEVLAPRELMASTFPAPDLATAIPKQFGTWTLVPSVAPITPGEPEGFVQPDTLSAKLYGQEVARGYSDGHGNIVMLLIAYGPVQNQRLKAHRPEICYTAQGFRVSNKSTTDLTYRADMPPLKLTRLITERESRFEPVSYWIRIGNDIATGVVENQLLRLKYGMRGMIPDGALMRVSTVGLSQQASYQLQDRFIHDLLASVAPENLSFFTGKS
jgi:EpsI family protein